MNFGEKLKELRVAAGMTQEQLATRSGTSKQNISRYELDERQPSLTMAKAIADALGVSLDDFREVMPSQTEKDARLLAWFRSLPPEKQKAILIAQDGPTEAV